MNVDELIRIRAVLPFPRGNNLLGTRLSSWGKAGDRGLSGVSASSCQLPWAGFRLGETGDFIPSCCLPIEEPRPGAGGNGSIDIDQVRSVAAQRHVDDLGAAQLDFPFTVQRDRPW